MKYTAVVTERNTIRVMTNFGSGHVPSGPCVKMESSAIAANVPAMIAIHISLDRFFSTGPVPSGFSGNAFFFAIRSLIDTLMISKATGRRLDNCVESLNASHGRDGDCPHR
jgi:hypothetical protein